MLEGEGVGGERVLEGEGVEEERVLRRRGWGEGKGEGGRMREREEGEVETDNVNFERLWPSQVIFGPEGYLSYSADFLLSASPSTLVLAIKISLIVLKLILTSNILCKSFHDSITCKD